MKAMTKKDLLMKNPWLEVAEMYNPKDKECLFSEKNCYVCKKDKAVIDKYNENLEKAANGKDEVTKEEILKDKIVTNIPAEPWWGNPLNARLIILSLNPGYVPEVNEKLAKLLQSNDIVREQLINYKAKTLRLEAESFLPTEDSSEPISCRDAVNMLGDWYWHKMLRHLKEEVIRRNANIEEDVFYKRIALIEYHAYSSIKSQRTFPLRNIFLDSQVFTKKLIWHISQKEDIRFLIMRAKDKWKKMLDDDNPGFYDSNVKKGKIVFKENKGMSQAITPNNLGKIFEDIATILAK